MSLTNKYLLLFFFHVITIPLCVASDNSQILQKNSRIKTLKTLIHTHSNKLIEFLQENPDLINIDIEHGKSIGHMLLFQARAAQNYNIEIVQDRLDTFWKWLQLNPTCTTTTKPDPEKNFPGGSTILHVFLFQVKSVFSENDLENKCFQKILELNPDLIHKKRDDGLTPSHIAAQRILIPFLKTFAEHGANLTEKAPVFNKETTPLEILRYKRLDTLANKLQETSLSIQNIKNEEANNQSPIADPIALVHHEESDTISSHPYILPITTNTQTSAGGAAAALTEEEWSFINSILDSNQDTKLIQYLKNNPSLANYIFNDGKTIGHHLLEQKRYNTFKYWLQFSLNEECITSQDREGNNILHTYLLQNKHQSISDILCQIKNKNIKLLTMRNNQNQIPNDLCEHISRFDLHQFLQPIHLAPQHTETTILKNLITYKTSNDILLQTLQDNPHLLDTEIERGQCIGHVLLYQKHFKAFERWLQLKPKCSAITSYDDMFPGSSVLHTYLITNKNANLDTVQAILQLNPTLATLSRQDGLTPAHISTLFNQFNILKLLQQYNANLNASATCDFDKILLHTRNITPLQIIAFKKNDNKKNIQYYLTNLGIPEHEQQSLLSQRDALVKKIRPLNPNNFKTDTTQTVIDFRLQHEDSKSNPTLTIDAGGGAATTSQLNFFHQTLNYNDDSDDESSSNYSLQQFPNSSTTKPLRRLYFISPDESVADRTKILYGIQKQIKK